MNEDSPLKTGYYYENPIRRSARPKYKMQGYSAKTPKIIEGIQCGPERWRFSQTGIVEVVSVLKHYARRQAGFRPLTEAEKAEQERTLPKSKWKTTVAHNELEWFVRDSQTDKLAIMTSDFWARLEIGGTHIVGVGWMFMEPPNAELRKDVHTCEKCGEICEYRAGQSPAISYGQTGLQENEWAIAKVPLLAQSATIEVLDVIEIFGGSLECYEKNVLLCRNCIPKHWIYCDYCDCIHRGWYTSNVFNGTRKSIVSDALGGRLKSLMRVRQYIAGTDWRTQEPDLVKKSDHVSERIMELVEFIGRATVCENPHPAYRKSLDMHLEELDDIYEWYEQYKENHDETDRNIESEESDNGSAECDAPIVAPKPVPRTSTRFPPVSETVQSRIGATPRHLANNLRRN